jgi:hypothetical protein
LLSLISWCFLPSVCCLPPVARLLFLTFVFIAPVAFGMAVRDLWAMHQGRMDSEGALRIWAALFIALIPAMLSVVFPFAVLLTFLFDVS